MTTLHTTLPHQSISTTRSVFGRRVKQGDEFNQFTQECLKMAKTGDIDLDKNEFNSSFSFKRSMPYIPIIGWIWHQFETGMDIGRVLLDLKSLDINNKKTIIIAHKTKKWWAYSTKKINDINEFSKNRNAELREKVVTDIKKHLPKDTTISDIDIRYIRNPDKKNERFALTRMTLSKQEEAQS